MRNDQTEQLCLFARDETALARDDDVSGSFEREHRLLGRREVQQVLLFEERFRQIHEADEKGSALIMFMYGADDFFGEFDIDEVFPSSYSIETTTDSVIGWISKQEMDELVRRDAQLATEMLRWTSMMRKQSEMKLRDLLLYGKPGALASTLLRMAAMDGVESAEGIIVPKHPSDGELGQLIGAPRETVNRMMNQWRKEGMLTTTGTEMILHNIDFLKELCYCEGCPAGICRL